MSEPQYSISRRWKRYKVDLRVKVTYTTEGAKQLAHGRGQDVSEGGMALFVPVELTTTDIVEIEFTLPYSSTSLRLKAGVRNRTGFRYGMEFLGMSEAQRQAIRRLCEAMTLLHD